MRLNLDDFKKKDWLAEGWSMIKDNCMNLIDKHGYMYSGSHVAMTIATCGSDMEKSILLNSLDKFINGGKNKSSRYLSIYFA